MKLFDKINTENNNIKVTIFFIVVYTLIIWVAPGWINGIRILQDNIDRSYYFNRGAFISRNITPYSPEHSVEYPQIAVYSFVIPHLLMKITPYSIQKTNDNQIQDLIYGSIKPGTYQKATMNIYSLLMALTFISFSFLTLKLLTSMNSSSYRLYIFILPAFMYFTINRYDILPAFFVTLAVYAFKKKYFLSGFIILAIATMTKWYPILFLPIFLNYLFYKKNIRESIKGALIFIIVSAIIILPTLLSTGTEGVLKPYLFQATRKADPLALLFYLQEFIASDNILKYILTACGFLPPVIGFFHKIDTFEKLLKWMSLSVAIFILSASFYSPQWLIWLTPIVILWCPKPIIGVLIAFDFISYLIFPVLFDVLGVQENPLHWSFALAVFIKSGIIASIAIFTIGSLRTKPGYEQSEKGLPD